MANKKITKQVIKKPVKTISKAETKKTVDCQYCRRTLPAKFCKRHQPQTKATKKKITEFTEERARAWFMKLDRAEFLALSNDWNEQNLKIKLPKLENYDQWLNHFKSMPPNVIKVLSTSGLDILPTEAYAALSRWHDIIKSPHRIDKIHQSGLTNDNAKRTGPDITELARSNDRMGVLRAVRDRIAEKLEKGAGARDTASLAREMGEILDQIAELERKSGPKKNTKLASLLNDDNAPPPRQRDKGSRNTSFKSRITIDDMEGA